MAFGFVGPALPLRARLSLRRPAIRATCEQPSGHTRRQVLGYLANVPIALLPITALPIQVQADRTGKYSTQLTAKRRYLPRIDKGLELIREASPSSGEGWQEAVAAFAAKRDDLVSALRLFGTSFFAEGNRIGPVERALKKYANDLDDAAKKLIRAADAGDRDAAGSAYEALMKAANSYVDAAKLKELLPDLKM